MFGFIYRYRIRTLLKSRVLIFWSFAFPLLLGCFFFAAFQNIDKTNIIDTIGVAIVTKSETSDTGENFKTQLTTIDNDGKKMFQVQSLSQKAAESALSDNKIAGYYTVDGEDIQLTVASDGMPQSMLSVFLNQYLQITKEITDIAKVDPTLLNQELVTKLATSQNYITTKENKSNGSDGLNFIFFTLIGMCCMFGLSFGIHNSQQSQANQRPEGIRISLSPNPKIISTLAYILAALTIQMIEISLLLVIFHNFFTIDFGTHWLILLAICCIACLAMISLGSFISHLLKNLTPDQQMSIAISIQMVLSFLAGMMGAGVKYMIDENIPILGYLNPVNLISDSFYRLYYYGEIQSIVPNVVSLVLFASVFFTLSIFVERRNQYASL